MSVKVGINGFGRIGRNILRATLGDPSIEVVAVNDITDSKTLAHLLKYDSILGNLPNRVTHTDDTISVDGKAFKVFKVKDPAELDWASVGASIVVESTGLFTKGADARKHIRGPVKKVIISAPATDPDHTVVLGVNDKTYDPRSTMSFPTLPAPRTASRPSRKCCTTSFGITIGTMTTIHSYTNDQKLLDLPHKDLRRARAAALSMIPTSTGAAKALHLVIPELKGKLDGYSIRVPTPNVSVVDLTVITEKPATVPERERGAEGRRRRAAEGHSGIHRRRTRLHRFPRQSAFVDRRCGLHARRRIELRQGSRLVRQRVGLLVPLPRSDQALRLQTLATRAALAQAFPE